MGLFSKIKKIANPIKHTKKVVKLGNKARKAGNKATKSALGMGSKGQHKKAGMRSGGKKAVARNARAKGPRLSASGGQMGNAARAIAGSRKYRGSKR